jgi:peptidoglycan-N-acetylglucosamine deacetylase
MITGSQRRHSNIETRWTRGVMCWRLCLAVAALFSALSIVESASRASTFSSFAGCVALTFDDGPDLTLTPQVLTILEQGHVPGTFFVLGQRVGVAPEIVRREVTDGDEIGNHSFDHRLLLRLTDAQVVDEIAMTDKAVIAASGLRPSLIRPPYGIWSEGIESALRNRGLMRPIALWDVDSFDWLDDDANTTVTRVGAVPSGSIVLMHDIHASTVAALPKILATLGAAHMRLTTVSGLADCLKDLSSALGETRRTTGEAMPMPHQPSGRSLLGAVFEWARNHGPS